MPTPSNFPRKTRRRVLGLLAFVAWLAVAWTYWQAQSVLPRQTVALNLPNYSFMTVPAGGPFAVLNPGKDELVFLDPATGQKEVVLKGDLKGAYSVIAASNRETVATLQTDGAVMVWHKAEGGEPTSFALPVLVYVACSPDGKMVGGHGPKENTVRLWEVASQKEVMTLDGHLVGGGDAFLPDSRTLATVTAEGVKLWDLSTRQPRLTLSGPARLYALAPDGQSLATCDTDDRVTVWDCGTGQARAHYRAPEHAQMMFYSPDGNKIAFTTSSPATTWYDSLSSWFRTSQDFKLMSLNEETVVVDAATGQKCAPVPTVASRVVFADDRTLASLSKTGDAIQLWDLPPRRFISPFLTWACLGVAFLLTAAWVFTREAGPKAK